MDIKEMQQKLAEAIEAKVTAEHKSAERKHEVDAAEAKAEAADLRAEKAEGLTEEAKAKTEEVEAAKAVVEGERDDAIKTNGEQKDLLEANEKRANELTEEVKELNAKIVDRDVDALIGTKCHADEGDLLKKLGRTNKELYDEQMKTMEKRSSLPYLKDIIPSEKGGDGPKTGDVDPPDTDGDTDTDTKTGAKSIDDRLREKRRELRELQQ